MLTALKRFFLFFFLPFFLVSATSHPIYVTVTEIEHNKKEHTLEISCKIFTNDFETILKKNYPNQKIDIIRPENKSSINDKINQYIQRHLKLVVDQKKVALQFIGYEQNEDCILVYFQVDGIQSFNSVSVIDNLLYDYKEEQISLIYFIKDGVRKSIKLNNPDDHYQFVF